MKRSEMFKLIYDKMCEPLSYHDDGGIQLAWQVERILNTIEEAGMLPPGREQDKIIFSTLTGEIKGYFYDQHVWDEEDEKK